MLIALLIVIAALYDLYFVLYYAGKVNEAFR